MRDERTIYQKKSQPVIDTTGMTFVLFNLQHPIIFARGERERRGAFIINIKKFLSPFWRLSNGIEFSVSFFLCLCVSL